MPRDQRRRPEMGQGAIFKVEFDEDITPASVKAVETAKKPGFVICPECGLCFQPDRYRDRRWISLQEAMAIWNDETWGVLASVTKPSVKRAKRLAYLQTFLPEYRTEQDFRSLCRAVVSSAFLRGERSDRRWCATFDFMLQEDSAIRLIEGNYDDPENDPQKRLLLQAHWNRLSWVVAFSKTRHLTAEDVVRFALIARASGADVAWLPERPTSLGRRLNQETANAILSTLVESDKQG